MAWYWYLFFIALVFAAGWLSSFLVMRNNPKYFNIDKMAKDELNSLITKAKARL